MNKIKMPARLLKKWLKALRSGEYKQTTGTLYNPKTGGFCCLGVLQHVASGKCEVNSDGDFEDGPSGSWYIDNGIRMSGEMEQILMQMNDGERDWPSSRRVGRKKFTTIANFIEKNTETF